jgi:hypothetical protein
MATGAIYAGIAGESVTVASIAAELLDMRATVADVSITSVAVAVQMLEDMARTKRLALTWTRGYVRGSMGQRARNITAALAAAQAT